jgi:hypothetical protein
LRAVLLYAPIVSPLRPDQNPGITSAVSTPEHFMQNEIPAASEAESGTGEIRELLNQAGALSDRVSKLRDGPRKEKLKAALLELQAIADDLAQDAVPK